MSATHVAITKQQVLALQALINAGFVIVAFSPAELDGADARTIEMQLTRHGKSLIENNRAARKAADQRGEKCYSRNLPTT